MFTGHDHFYERVKPQKGIVYFVVGSGGKLRTGNIDEPSRASRPRASTPTRRFMVVEISDDEMYFNAISRHGADRRLGRHHAPEAAAVAFSRVPSSALFAAL